MRHDHPSVMSPRNPFTLSLSEGERDAPFALSLSKGGRRAQAGIRQAQPERVFETLCVPLLFALSLSKGGRRAQAVLRQAQSERDSPARQTGFTLIELMVVLAIIALLSTIVAPRYFRSVQHAREVTLRTDLNVMRDAIDKFLADQGRYPKSLTELQERRYIRDIPEDPITDRRDSWLMLPPPPDSTLHDGMADVRSGAAGTAQDGTPYRDF